MDCYILLVPIDILNEIINSYNMEIRTKMYFMSACCMFWKNISIYCLRTEDIDNNSLCQLRFRNITNLNISYNTKITNISYLSNLITLNISQTLIGQDNISIMNLSKLTSLNISKQRNITCLNHLTSLTLLKACDIFGAVKIDKLINLVDLNIASSSEIEYDTNKLTNLTKLNIMYNRGNIRNISILTNLRKLNAGSYYNNIKQSDINTLFNLISLKIFNNGRITNITHLTKLTSLDIAGKYCIIDQNNINRLPSLTKLRKTDNLNIISTSHLTNLRYIK